VVGIYLATSWGVLNAVDVLTGFAGLPDWTPTMAVVLLLIGFPIVTATAVIQKGLPGGGGSAADPDPGAVPSRVGSVAVGGASAEAPTAAGRETQVSGRSVRALFTWRNALVGGAAAGMLLLVSGGAYLAMWSMGVGPVGSLVAQGVLESRDPILLVDFEDGPGAEDLGAIVSGALAVDLGASPVVTLLGKDVVENMLRLMGRDPSERMSNAAAREVAVRANIKAFIEGDVTRVGSRYLIVSRIVSPQSGEDLVSFREEASSEDDLLPAIDRLSQRLREKLGESLREIRLGAPLEEVTTGSFEALRKLTQAERAEEGGEYALAERLLNEAIALDPQFAMAHRKLSVIRFNAGLPGVEEAASLAYQHRDRLTDRERYLTEANYHTNVTLDDRAALEAYDALLEIRPDDPAGLNNSANILRRLTRYQEAGERLDRAVGRESGASSVAYFNQVRVRYYLGDIPGTLQAVAAYRERFPGHIYQPWADYLETLAVGEVGGLDRRIQDFAGLEDVPFLGRQAARYGAAAAIGDGRLTHALEWTEEVSHGVSTFLFVGFYPFSTGTAEIRYWILDDPEGAVRTLQSEWEPMLETPPEDGFGLRWPWGEAATLYALSGRADLARALLQRWEVEAGPLSSPAAGAQLEVARAMIEGLEGAAESALDRVESAGQEIGCPRCFDQQRAVLLERLERFDEAIVIWEAARDLPLEIEARGWERAVALRRLGPLHEQAGDTAGAIAAYRAFAEAWVDADPELQPQVAQARQRITALEGS
jgi:tetratricopeptide (TPR) repeat protein